MFEKGNDGVVKRPVDGFVFHYPCYFAPPMSVIRQGDFKYMRHLLSGEVLLFNLAEDIGEKNNIAAQHPDKVAALDRALTAYLSDIDAEDIQDVYQARLEELDRFEKMARDNFKKQYAAAEQSGDTIAMVRLTDQLAKDLIRFDRNREEVRINKNSKHWAGSPPLK